jgi:hypothetical protein
VRQSSVMLTKVSISNCSYPYSSYWRRLDFPLTFPDSHPIIPHRERESVCNK